MVKTNSAANLGLAGIALAWTLSAVLPNSTKGANETTKSETKVKQGNNLAGFSLPFSSSSNSGARNIHLYTDNGTILSKRQISNLVSGIYDKISSKGKIPQYMPKRFFEASILAESGGDVYAVGSRGERGLMQLMPGHMGTNGS